MKGGKIALPSGLTAEREGTSKMGMLFRNKLHFAQGTQHSFVQSLSST